MQELVNVDIEDVYPYEDAEGNSLNPRDFTTPESAEYIAQLGEQFRFNKLNPGQPRVKPILYRDGGIYWIIDGECRYRAMRAIGTKRFLAEVYDDLSDAETARAEAAKAMVETDCKLNLTPAEMSRGVQQMLALDLPDEEVAAVARIEPEKVRRARRGAARVEDAAYDMTLDRLMAIAEFEGDPEAVAKLRDCPQKDWRRVYEGLARERAHRERVEGLERVLAAAGVPRVAEDDETERRCAGNLWIASTSPERLETAMADAKPTAYDIDGNWLELLREESDEERAMGERRREEAAEAERARQRAGELWEVERAGMLEWLSGRIGDLKAMRRTAAVLSGRAAESVEGVLAEMGAEVDMSPTAALCVVGWAATWFPGPDCAVSLSQGKVLAWQVNTYNAEHYIALADAMEADGYEFGEVGQAVNETLRKHLEEKDG